MAGRGRHLLMARAEAYGFESCLGHSLLRRSEYLYSAPITRTDPPE